MQETRNAQISIFHFYAPHALGDQLSMLSDLLDDHPLILDCVERDFRGRDTAATGASGLSVESVFRCLLLKQILKVSYEKDALYPQLLRNATLVMKQSRSAIYKVRLNAKNSVNAQRWIDKVEHFLALLPGAGCEKKYIQ